MTSPVAVTATGRKGLHNGDGVVVAFRILSSLLGRVPRVLEIAGTPGPVAPVAATASNHALRDGVPAPDC
jgi:hypothetical protein